MLRSAVDWLWESDAQRNLTYLSTSFSSVFALPARCLIGRPLQELLGGGGSELTVRRVATAMARQQPFRERLNLAPEGEGEGEGEGAEAGLPHLITAVPHYDPDTGRFAGYRGTGTVLPAGHVRDNSEDEAARQLMEMLEDALARKDELEWELSKAGDRAFRSRLASVAHELRTPLNAIMGFAEIIAGRHLGGDLNRYQDYGRDIYDSGRHLLEVIDNLLNQAQMPGGEASAASEVVDLHEIAASVLRMLEDRARDADVLLINDVAPETPKTRTERRALRQILINLVANGIKYTPPGGAVGIESANKYDDRLALTVWDTGVGIAQEDQERVFQRSYRVAGTGLERPGSGLGLAISRDLARALGGDITIASRPGEGSRLTLWLPIARAPGPSGAETAGRDA
ncbi:MAG: HAMP domain-containing histidine kinase [Rhodospirillales bacterium]|nr:HAMP domain-containing histidine kinase [Rhodospirillales bacterium]